MHLQPPCAWPRNCMEPVRGEFLGRTNQSTDRAASSDVTGLGPRWRTIFETMAFTAFLHRVNAGHFLDDAHRADETVAPRKTKRPSSLVCA